jgi:hypothetical protein
MRSLAESQAKELAFWPATANAWTWTSQRCGRYKYQKLLVHTTNPDHLAASTPSLTDVPPLQVTSRYRRDDGSTMNRSSQWST